MKTIFIRAAVLSVFIVFCQIYPASAQGLQTIQLTGLKADSRNGNLNLSWKTSNEEGLRQFEIEYSRDGINYRNLGFIPARNQLNGDFYEFEQPVNYTDSAFYRLKIVDNTGRWLYSDPVLFHVNKTTAFFVYPSVITTHVINMYVNNSFRWLEIVSMNGTVMLKQNLSNKMGRIDVPVSPNLAPGMYIVQLSNDYRAITQKIMIQ